MNPQLVIPDVQAAVLCEDVRQELNGINSLIGVVNIIPSPHIPFGIFKLCLWTRWSNGLGRFKQTARLLTPDEKKVMAEASIEFELKSIEQHSTNVNVFGGLQFQEFGIYTVEILINDNLKTRFSVPVVRVRHPQQGRQPQPEITEE